jgi:hypothetical protein
MNFLKKYKLDVGEVNEKMIDEKFQKTIVI